jgi:hypothetical protein
LSKFINNPIYTKDQPNFEFKVFGFFIYCLLFNSNVLYQFKALKAIELISFICLPFILIFSFLYYYYKVFQLKQLNRVDVIVFLFFLIPMYNAIVIHLVLDVKLLTGLKKVFPSFYISSASLIYYMIRTNRLTIKQYVTSNVMLSWFTLIFYTYVSFTLDPATFKDLDDGLVGFNPSKGGYIFRFSSAFLMFGMVYYFLEYILKNNYFALFSWLILIAYQIFIDKGRAEFISEITPMFLYMFIVLKWHQTARKLLELFFILFFVALVLYFVYPEALSFTADMYIVFIKFMLGQKTGEGSADMRWEEMAAVYNYFEKHPTHIFFGIGVPEKLTMQLLVGNVVLTDIGVVGGLLSQGIIGVLVINCFFLYPLYLAFKIKHYRNNLYYNAGQLLIVMIFIQSMFGGAIYYSGFGFVLGFLIIEYYRAKEAQYNDELKIKNQDEKNN